jgi:hypothetical protein
MDWLRSEDLKEENVVTTPASLYHARKWLVAPNWPTNRPERRSPK